jgi:hypothetical protein
MLICIHPQPQIKPSIVMIDVSIADLRKGRGPHLVSLLDSKADVESVSQTVTAWVRQVGDKIGIPKLGFDRWPWLASWA